MAFLIFISLAFQQCGQSLGPLDIFLRRLIRSITAPRTLKSFNLSSQIVNSGSGLTGKRG
jgi:hypothetical protein